MDNIPNLPPPTCAQWLYSCLPERQTVKNIVFAIAMIVAIGALLAGVLSLIKFPLFNQLNSVATQALLYGGGGVALVATTLKVIDCLHKPREFQYKYMIASEDKDDDSKEKILIKDPSPSSPPAPPEEKIPQVPPKKEVPKDPNQMAMETPSFPFLDSVKEKNLPVNGKLDQVFFLQGLQNLLKGIIAGNCASYGLKGEGAVSSSDIESLIEFGLTRIKAYEEIADKIDNSLLGSLPQELLNTFREYRIKIFTAMIESLMLKGEPCESYWVIKFIAQIKNEMTVLNKGMKSLMEKRSEWAWNFKEICIKEVCSDFEELEKLIQAWKAMEVALSDKLDTKGKIEQLGIIESLLPQSDDEVWKYERIKSSMVASYDQICSNLLFANTGKTFFDGTKDQQDQQDQKDMVQIESKFSKIAAKLRIHRTQTFVDRTEQIKNTPAVAEAEQEYEKGLQEEQDGQIADLLNRQINPHLYLDPEPSKQQSDCSIL